MGAVYTSKRPVQHLGSYAAFASGQHFFGAVPAGKIWRVRSFAFSVGGIRGVAASCGFDLGVAGFGVDVLQLTTDGSTDLRSAVGDWGLPAGSRLYVNSAGALGISCWVSGLVLYP